MTISRDDAQKAAETHIENNIDKYVRIEKMISPDEANHRLPLIYNLQEELKNCWIAYLRFPIREADPFALQSSTIIVISKKTGEVIYSGSANDEG